LRWSGGKVLAPLGDLWKEEEVLTFRDQAKGKDLVSKPFV